jgi:hypothetical protein
VTQILTRTSRAFALMVTDRLVTTNKGEQFDPHANKNIVFCARNAVVAMGYTGRAYIGKTPTDQWLVEKLTGLDFPLTRQGRALMERKLRD